MWRVSLASRQVDARAFQPPHCDFSERGSRRPRSDLRVRPAPTKPWRRCAPNFNRQDFECRGTEAPSVAYKSAILAGAVMKPRGYMPPPSIARQARPQRRQGRQAAFVFPAIKELHDALDRVYKPAMSLPQVSPQP